jgi:pilus assembly protein FimV
MQRKLVKSLSGLSLVWLTSSVYALGLGDIELRSGLSQPFLAEIPLLSATEEDLISARVSLASAEEFDRAGLERGLYMSMLKFEIEAPADGTPYVKVFSSKPVDEPFLDFLVVIEWPSGRLVREYTVLLDPPVTMGTGFQRAESSSRRETPVSDKPSEPRAAAPAPSAGGGRASKRAVPKIDPNEPAPTFNAAGDVTVQRNETLWSIANRIKPAASISTDEMMMALLRANPQAFVNGDMDRLRAGATLRVPVESDIAALAQGQSVPVSAPAAPEEVAAPVEPAPTEAAAPAPAAEAPPPAPTEEKRLTLETPKQGEAGQAANAGSDAAMEAQLALAKEEAEVERNKNQELAKRVEELEAQMQRFEEMVALKNQELAAIQNRVAAGAAPADGTTAPPADAPPTTEPIAESPVAETPTEAEVPVTPEVAEPVAQAPGDGAVPVVDGVTSDASAEAAAPAPTEQTPPVAETPPVEIAPEQPVEAAPEASAEPAPVVAEPVPPPVAAPEAPVVDTTPPPPPAPVPFWQQPYFLGGALLGIAALLGAGLFALRRRQMETEYAEGAVETLVVEPAEPTVVPLNKSRPTAKVERAAEAPSVSPAKLAAAAAAPVMASAHDGVHVGDHSPLEEADVYLAYGQYQQAADVIKHAMERESTGIEYRFKLVQIYAAMKDRPSFIEEAESLQIAAGDEYPEVWEKAVALGRELCPDHYLFGGSQGAPGGDDDASSEDSGFVGELDLGLGNNKTLASAFESLSAAAPAESPKQELDFSLDFDAPAAKPVSGGQGGLDFSLDFDKTIPATASAPNVGAAAEEKPALDFLSAFERVDAAVEAKPNGAAPQFPSLDMENMPSLFSKDSQPLDDLSMDVGDEIGTKLDLARAYIDMGDDEGARSILDEVVQEGNSVQKQEAQKILAGIH